MSLPPCNDNRLPISKSSGSLAVDVALNNMSEQGIFGAKLLQSKLRNMRAELVHSRQEVSHLLEELHRLREQVSQMQAEN